jgi:hypothetical protein
MVHDPTPSVTDSSDWMSTCSYFSGFQNKDVAFLHKTSKTLIVADLLMNLPAKEQVRARYGLPYDGYRLEFTII